MNFFQFFRILWSRRMIPAITTIAFLVGAVGIASLLQPRYEAKSRLMLDIVKPDPVTGEVIASQFARAYVSTQIELIKDYRIAGKVADMTGMTSSQAWADAYAARSSSDTRDFRHWAAQQIIDNTDAQLIEASNILEISYSGPDPAGAAEMADAIRQAYVDSQLAFRRDDAANNAEWFRTQARRIRQELGQAEAKKAAFEKANNIVLTDDQVDADTVRLSALAQSAPAAAGPAAAAPIVAPPNPALAQLAQADAAIAAAERTLGPNNPDLINMKRQRAAIAATANSGGQVIASSRGSSGPSIGTLFNEQQRKVLASRGKVGEAQQLAADVRVLKDQYAKTAARAAELQQEGQSTETGLTLLGNATAPESPAYPKWPLVIFGSLALGLVLGCLLALIVELASRKVRSADDLLMLDVPILGVMARREKEPKRQPWLGALRWPLRSRSQLAEA